MHRSPARRRSAALRCQQRSANRHPGGSVEEGWHDALQSSGAPISSRGPFRGMLRSRPVGIWVLAPLEEVHDLTQLDDAPGVHHRHFVAHLGDDPHVVSDKEHRRARPLLELLDESRESATGS